MQMHQDAKPRCGILVHLKPTQNTPRVVYSICAWNAYYRFDYNWFRRAHNNTAEKTRRRLYGLIQSGYLTLILYFFCDFFTLDFSPSTFNPRHFTVDFLPSTFYRRLLTLDFYNPRLFTVDFLPSPSTFYPHPRLFTLALDFLPSPSTFNPRHSTNR